MQDYQTTVDELSKTAGALHTQPPSLDLRQELEDFGRTLRLKPREARPAEMRKRVRPLVEERLSEWRLGLEGAPGLLTRLHNVVEQIESDKSKAERVVAEADAKRRDFETKLDHLHGREERMLREEETLKPPSRFTVMSYRLLVLGSLLVGIVTAWYYLGMQVQIQAAKLGQPIKSTLDYLQQHPEEIIYVFGVVVFLLAGKIVSTIHARLNHPAWLFIPVALLAISSTVSTVVLIASVSAMQQENIGIERAIVQANPPGLRQVNCIATPDADACRKVKALQEQQGGLATRMASQSFWMTILVMLAEILLGAVAWMLASEHHEKHGAARQILDQKLAANKQQLQVIEKQIQEQKEAHDRANADRLLADRLIHQLDQLRARIPGREFIERTAQSALDKQFAVGSEVLNALEEKWTVDQVQPNSAA